MKRLLISAAATAARVTGLMLGLHSMSNLDPILEANVEALTNGEGDVVDVPCVSRDSECVMTVRDINGNQYELTISGLANKGILVR